MSLRFHLTRAALVAAAASVCLFAAPQIAAAQYRASDYGSNASSDQGGAYGDQCGQAERSACQPGQPVPYAGQPSPSQPVPYAGERSDIDRAPLPSPPPPPPPAPPIGYTASNDGHYAGADSSNSHHGQPRERCQMVEDRILLPDGTTETSNVQACRDRGGHWYVTD